LRQVFQLKSEDTHQNSKRIMGDLENQTVMSCGTMIEGESAADEEACREL